MMLMSVNQGKNYYTLQPSPAGAQTFPSGISRVISMSFSPHADKWLVAYTDGTVFLGTRYFEKNYTNNSFWLGTSSVSDLTYNTDWKVQSSLGLMITGKRSLLWLPTNGDPTAPMLGSTARCGSCPTLTRWWTMWEVTVMGEGSR